MASQDALAEALADGGGSEDVADDGEEVSRAFSTCAGEVQELLCAMAMPLQILSFLESCKD